MNIKEILNTQLRLQAAMGYPMGVDSVACCRDNIFAAMVELVEALNEMPWKSWKPRGPMFTYEKNKVLEELTDVLQFWANAVSAMGFDANDVDRTLRAKWQVNLDRIARGEVIS